MNINLDDTIPEMARRRLRRQQMGIIDTNDASTSIVSLVLVGMVGFGASNLVMGDKAPIVSTHFDKETNAAFTSLGFVSFLCLRVSRRPSMILKTLMGGLCVSLVGTMSCSADMSGSVCSHLNFSATVGTGSFLVLLLIKDFVRRHLLFNILIQRVNAAYKMSSMSQASFSSCVKYPVRFLIKSLFFSESKFGYNGQVDDAGRPHGHGTWHDSVRHGEILHGFWKRGLPVGPFRSIEFSTGYTSECIKVIYAKNRKESVSDLWFKSMRDAVTWGTCFVECSTSGHFYRHLPDMTQPVEECSSCCWEDCICDEADASPPLLPFDTFDDAQKKECTVAVDQGGALYLNGRKSTETSVTIKVEDGRIHLPELLCCKKEAVVFIHGFNSSCEDAIMRIGQLWGLAGFPTNIHPVVFAWPACKTVFYFRAKRMCTDEQVVCDLCSTLWKIFDSGCKVHVICHSMGAILFMAALQKIQGQFLFSTVSLLNPDCDIEYFLEHAYDKLRSMCDIITLYADESDNALWYSEVFNRWKALGKHPYDITTREDESVDQELAVTLNHLNSCRPLDIDVIDVSSMDNNMHAMRHNFFNLNRLMVDDLREILTQKRRASQRPRLTHISLNVYSFLNAPRHIKNK